MQTPEQQHSLVLQLASPIQDTGGSSQGQLLLQYPKQQQRSPPSTPEHGFSGPQGSGGSKQGQFDVQTPKQQHSPSSQSLGSMQSVQQGTALQLYPQQYGETAGQGLGPPLP